MFLEDQRLPIDISYGSGFSNAFSVEVVKVQGGDEFRALNHPYVMLEYNAIYEEKLQRAMSEMSDLYRKANGPFKGFRVKDLVDFTTNANGRSPHSALDQYLPLANPTIPSIYQMTKWYFDPTDPYCARRRLRKPVPGTALVANNGLELTGGFAVDYTTGLITITTDNKHASITGIEKGLSTTVSILDGASFEVGESVYFSGVEGMAQINGLRGEITSITPGSGGSVFISDVIGLIIVDVGGGDWAVQAQLNTLGPITDGYPIVFSELTGEFAALNGITLTVFAFDSDAKTFACLGAPAITEEWVSGGKVSSSGGGSPNYVVNINSLEFDDYTSGGSLDTLPANGFTFGCEFDIPCRFDEDFKGTFPDWEQLHVTGLTIVEILNP